MLSSLCAIAIKRVVILISSQARWAGHQGGIQVKGLPWGSRGEGKGCPQRANKGASPQVYFYMNVKTSPADHDMTFIRDGKSVQDSPPAVKKSRTEAVTMATLDADDPVDSSDSDGDDSDDDTAVDRCYQAIFVSS